MHADARETRLQILELVKKYYAERHGEKKFVPGRTQVDFAGRVFDENELVSLVDASLDFWLTTGRFAQELEGGISEYFGLSHAILTNSGSSANLLALTALTSPKLGSRRLLPGDEVITVASGFPTTVNPIYQNGLVPVFLDIALPTYNVDVAWLDKALSARTRAIMIAHTLGNPFDLDAVTDFARRNNLWLIEDCCDALGAEYRGKKVGAFGDLATLSFYPAHHITTGEGGCVLTDDRLLKTVVESFRDWGRDCWCEPGKDNTCRKRYDWQLGELPYGYDHKYTYSHIGYNLKLTDMQAAVGVAQLRKLPGFVEKRRINFGKLYNGLKDLEEFFILPEPTPCSDPSWFGFPVSVRPDAPFSRNDMLRFLEARKVATRLLFGGNLLRQPAYLSKRCRVVGDLANSDFVMDRMFWIGVYPGLTEAMIDYMIEAFHSAVDGLVRPSNSRVKEAAS